MEVQQESGNALASVANRLIDGKGCRFGLLLIALLTASCSPVSPTLAPTMDGSSSTPAGTATPRPIPSPTPASISSPIPLPTATPVPVTVEGYWIQNTVQDGLCTDSPRFIEFDARPSYLIGASGSIVCSIYAIAPHPTCGCGGDCPGGFPSWRAVEVPGLLGVTSGAFVHPDPSEVPNSPECYDLPSFAGSGGRCVQDLSAEWRCLTSADGLPFDDIRAYGIVEETNVEWLISEDRLASLGMEPEDQLYPLPSLLDDPSVRLTWLAVPETAGEGIWVGTDAHGVVHVDPASGQISHFTTSDGLPADAIRDVQTCGPDCVWVATSNGIGHWDGVQWTTYTTRDGLPSEDVRGISFDSLHQRTTSNVWAATAAGPAALLRGSDRWQAVPGWPEGVELAGVMGSWFSTRGHGLARFITSPVMRGTAELFTTDHGLPGDRVTALAATERGVLVGTPGGAVEWAGTTWNPVTAAPVNDAGRHLIGTEHGLWVWSGGDWAQVSDERVIQVAGNGWYATDDGVCQWSGGAPECPLTGDGRALAGVQRLYAPPDSEIVAVIDGAGQLRQLDAQACEGGCFTLEKYGALDSCGPILPARINGIAAIEGEWMVATDQGVYNGWLGGDRSLSGGWPLAVRDVRLGEDKAWIATSQGAFYTPLEEWPETSWVYLTGLPEQDISVVLPLPDGTVWLGTMDGGAIHFDPMGE